MGRISVFSAALIALALLLWWLNRNRPSDLAYPFEETEILLPEEETLQEQLPPDRLKPVDSGEAVAPVPSLPEVEQKPPAPAAQASPTKADDLRKIEGIGPKIASILNEHGISTYAGLAKMDAENLKRLLDEASLYFADPTTWPEQARLADAGAWTALSELQAKLKGGRRRA